jgi:hypothetical protein
MCFIFTFSFKSIGFYVQSTFSRSILFQCEYVLKYYMFHLSSGLFAAVGWIVFPLDFGEPGDAFYTVDSLGDGIRLSVSASAISLIAFILYLVGRKEMMAQVPSNAVYEMTSPSVTS